MEDKKEKWTNYLAMTTVIIAVCATLATFKGGGYSTRALMNQTKASNQWAFYQSKSVKSYIYETRKDDLETQCAEFENEKKAPELIDKLKEKIDAYNKKTAKYEEEKKQIYDDAKNFEKESDVAKKHADAFGFAVIFLQVSILLSSISALTKRKYVWYISVAIGLAGILYFINGFSLYLNL